MAFTERGAEEAAQIKSAQETLLAWCDAVEGALHAQSHHYAWAPGSGGERLHKIRADGKLLHDFGPRNAQLEQIVQQHADLQSNADETLQRLTQERRRMQKLNVAHGVGRLLTTPLKVLEVLRLKGLMRYYTVIGTYAMYAYEAAAGVVFDEPTMATNDVDLFYTAEKQMKFAEVVPGQASMLDVLREADPTFVRNEEQKESAMNDQGFSVDFLRREEADPYSDAHSISGTEGDVYPVKARRSMRFVSSPSFEQVVIAVDGSMTLMRTIDPKTFVEFKLWMADLNDRDPLKRNRDRLQALAIQQLLAEGRLASRL